jgi:hypothetical protein
MVGVLALGATSCSSSPSTSAPKSSAKTACETLVHDLPRNVGYPIGIFLDGEGSGNARLVAASTTLVNDIREEENLPSRVLVSALHSFEETCVELGYLKVTPFEQDQLTPDTSPP